MAQPNERMTPHQMVEKDGGEGDDGTLTRRHHEACNEQPGG
jgi:hypothetical protein